MSTVPLAPNKIVTSPPNCTDGDGWDSWTRSNTVDYKYQVYDAIANDVMNIYINAHGGMMGCCPCPNGAKSVESKFMSCANNMFVFDRDFGGPVSIRYDPSQNWAYYLGVMQSMFGYNPRISTVTCHGEACCYRVREFCIQNQSLVSVTDSGWQVLGDCEEAEDPCDLILCNHEDP